MFRHVTLPDIAIAWKFTIVSYDTLDIRNFLNIVYELLNSQYLIRSLELPLFGQANHSNKQM